MVEESVIVAGHLLKLGLCKRCEFIWFDTPEYESITPPKPPEAARVPEENLPQAAREVLALYKVQQIAEQVREQNPEPDAGWKAVPAAFGLPVEMDSDPLTKVPIATFGVALVVAAVSLWAFSNLQTVVTEFGLIPDEAWRYGGLTMLTSFFLHGGTIHLLSNLYFMIVFGVHVENYLGWRRWLLLVLVATIIGNLFQIFLDPRGDTPSIGASGGISGLMAFYAFKFPHARLGFFLRFQWIQMPAWGAFLMWILLQCLGAAKQLNGFGHVAAVAHLGGALGGIMAWVAWRKVDAKSAF